MRTLVLTMLLLSISLSGFGKEIEFEQITVLDGLSQNSGLKLAQDHWGRIWIGTQDGINVYDGTRIKNYFPEKDNNKSLLGRKVRDLLVLDEELWVVTTQGVSSFNFKTDEFHQFPMHNLTAIAYFNETIYLGSTKDGLYEMALLEGKKLVTKNQYKDIGTVNDFMLDSNGSLWICSNNGLYKKDLHQTPELAIKGNFNSITIDSNDRIWLGTANNGIYLLNKEFELIKHFHDASNDKFELVNNIVRVISEDKDGDLWVGTFLGLSIINGKDLTVKNYQVDKENKKSLSHNSIYSIIKDINGNMWIGTYFGGVNYYNPKNQIYKHYHKLGNTPEKISFQVISSILEDDNNNLWIGTDGGGLMHFNRSTQSFTHYAHHSQKNSISHNNVKTLILGNDDKLIIGTHLGGLNILNLKNNHFEYFKEKSGKPHALTSNIIMDVVKIGESYLIGTYGGIMQFDLSSQTFTPLLSPQQTNICSERITALCKDSYGLIWIGTEYNGLFTYELKSKELKKQNLENYNNNLEITTIFEDHKLRLWIGSAGNGLYTFDRNNNRFENYTIKNSEILSDVIRGVAESRYGGIWISSNKGLTLFNLEKNLYFNYSIKDGFPLTELSPRSLLMCADGELFVGGINGLVSFNENDLLKMDNTSQLLFTDLHVNNRKVKIGDDTKTLNQSLEYTKSITLQPSHHVFSIYFSACNYSSSIKRKFQYTLEGFSNEWHDADPQNPITFTNLDPGHYTMKIRILDQLINKLIDEKELHIYIKPPIYKTWYAYLFYAVLFLGILGLINRFYLTRVRLEDKLAFEHREREKTIELNQAKMNFFTNISHEFRTPLTLISGTIEGLLDDFKTSAPSYRKILSINRNAKQLQKLISELLDFRKIEDGHFHLKISECSLNDFLAEITTNFEEFAQNQKITLKYTPLPNDARVWIDQEQMEKVFYNLLSNAFKAVKKDEGLIQITISENLNCYEVSVSDNGLGIKAELQKNIFDQYYQLEQWPDLKQTPGTGLGLALSKSIINEHHGEINLASDMNHGATFIVTIQKGNRHFSKDQLLLDLNSRPIKFTSSIQKEIEEIEEIEENGNNPVHPSTILIVEDNEEVRQLIRNIFKLHYNILEANDGKQGLQMAIDHNPDLIISDVMMPNLSGTQMCSILKRNINTCHIPIVLLTARTAIEHKIEGLETGADDYIEKPFNLKLLKARIHNLLLNKKYLREKFLVAPDLDISEIVPNPLDKEIMDKALRIVEQNLANETFDVEQFAREMGLGRTRLYSKLKGVTGQTPNEFILTIRMKKASNLLTTNNDMNISDVAYATGFSSPDYFGKCFRNYFGMSPSAYVDADLERKKQTSGERRPS